MEPTDIAWLAGLIDGEGTITVRRWSQKGGSGKRNPAFAVQLSVSNTNPKIIRRAYKLMSEITGSGVGIAVLNYREPPQRHCYQVYVSSQKSMKQVLQTVYPHLVGKTEQASIALEILEKRGLSHRVPEECWQLAQRLSEANNRFIPPLTPKELMAPGPPVETECGAPAMGGATVHAA